MQYKLYAYINCTQMHETRTRKFIVLESSISMIEKEGYQGGTGVS
jgi:hypothetical protein